MFTGKTKNLGIVGYPVKHSLSPVLQNAALKAAGQDYVYVALPVASDELHIAFMGLKAMGFRGFNLTIPHKEKILSFLDEIDETAKIIGAVNTVVFENGRSYGYNTDAIGFISALQKGKISLENKKVVLLGAGGAAHAVIWGLIKNKVKSICIGVRNVKKAQLVADAFSKYTTIKIFDWTKEYFQKSLGNADLLVNTTPMGMYPKIDEAPPVSWEYINKRTFVYDVIYTPRKTLFLQQAEANGNLVLNGEGMLVGQGAAAFKLWTGVEPDMELMTMKLREQLERLQKE
ncbi:MAG: shikimate dehydrogenase [Selenomonadaceae bacterium]